MNWLAGAAHPLGIWRPPADSTVAALRQERRLWLDNALAVAHPWRIQRIPGAQLTGS